MLASDWSDMNNSGIKVLVYIMKWHWPTLHNELQAILSMFLHRKLAPQEYLGGEAKVWLGS